MGRQPCCDKVGLKKGPWTAEEDKKLITFIITNGQCCWRAVPKLAGLLRCGKSCRLRWTNYLRPDLKRGLLSESEEKMVIELHSQLGNRWSKIASHLPGRTDNEIKNHWNTHIKKKLKKMGIDPLTHKPLPPHDQPQQEQPTSSGSGIVEMDNQNKEIDLFETPVNSSITTEAIEEEKSPFGSNIEAQNEFCTDEVPLIEPHEILVPNCYAPSSSTSSISSSASPSTSSGGHNNTMGSSNMLEDLQFLPNFDWQFDYNANNNMGFWDDDYFSSLDFFINDDNDRIDLTAENPINHCLRMVLDEDSV